jgi:hypothetical protein
MRWWTRRAPAFAALVAVALATGPAALAQAPGTDAPSAPGRSTTTTALPTSTDPTTTETTTTAPPDTGGGAATSNAPGKAGRGSTTTSNPPRSTTSTTTTTTTILAVASGTWITARLQPRVGEPRNAAVGPQAAPGLR